MINYFDLLSGAPIFEPGVGHIVSPKLKDLEQIFGIDGYRFYIALLMWDKPGLIRYMQLAGMKCPEKLNNEKLGVFDVISLYPDLVELYSKVLSFFIVETLSWNSRFRAFVVMDGEEMVGVINRENYAALAKDILLANHIKIDEKKETKFISDTAKELWQRAQAHDAKAKRDDDRYSIANMVSKLCVVHPSYNLLNIFDLTIYQLHDAFIQYEFMRGVDFSNRVFSIHGGDKFNFDDWVRPITNNNK